MYIDSSNDEACVAFAIRLKIADFPKSYYPKLLVLNKYLMESVLDMSLVFWWDNQLSCWLLILVGNGVGEETGFMSPHM